MAKRRRSTHRRATIDHFRGINQDVLLEDNTYSRTVLGLYDKYGGSLSRIGGKIAHGSNPLGSIWSINQLRFKDNWGLVVQNTSARLWYDHRTYMGPEDGYIPYLPERDVDIYTDEGDDYIPPDIPPPPPTLSHSDIIPIWGEAEYFVTPSICQRYQAGFGQSAAYGVITDLYTTFDTAVSNAWVGRSFPPGDWGGWTLYEAGDPGLIAPYLRIKFQYMKNHAGNCWYYVGIWFQFVQQKACSMYLASPPSTPWGSPFEDAEFEGNLGIYTVDLSDYVGDANADCAVGCANVSTPIVGTLPGGQSDLESDTATSRAFCSAVIDMCENLDPTATVFTIDWAPGSYDYRTNYDSSAPKIRFYAMGGTFKHVWSHFEE